jgi:hypothetical protein
MSCVQNRARAHEQQALERGVVQGVIKGRDEGER